VDSFEYKLWKDEQKSGLVVQWLSGQCEAASGFRLSLATSHLTTDH